MSLLILLTVAHVHFSNSFCTTEIYGREEKVLFGFGI